MQSFQPAVGASAAVPAGEHASLRRANLSLVLRSLRDAGPRSRARLAVELGLNKATVSSLVSELASRGLVSQAGVERGAVGRPGRSVQLDGRTVCGVGAEINVDHIAVFARDLAGTEVSQRRIPIDTVQLDGAEVLDRLAELVASVFDDVAAQGARPVGLTVGIAGLVDADRALLTHGPNLGWRDVPLADMLRERLGGPAYPITLDNDANLAAIAELVPGDLVRRHMLVIVGEVGVGGGIISDGRLLRGHRGWAGELGHMIVDPRGLPCGCGHTGCWETRIGLRALVDAVADPHDLLRSPNLGRDERIAEISRRARLGDDRTLAGLAQVGGWVGIGTASLANALNPGVIVLTGYLAELGPWMRDTIEAQLQAGVLAPGAGGTRLEFSTLGYNATVLGGAAMALEAVFHDPTCVERLVSSNGATR